LARDSRKGVTQMTPNPTPADRLEAALDWILEKSDAGLISVDGDRYPAQLAIMNDAARAHLADLRREEVEDMSERAILCRALDKMGWPEIHAFQDEFKKGQSIYEDAGGYFMRGIKRLFGIAPRDEVVTYQQAAQALIDQATLNKEIAE